MDITEHQANRIREDIKHLKPSLFREWAGIKDGEWIGISFEDFLIKRIIELEDDAEDARLQALEEYPD